MKKLGLLLVEDNDYDAWFFEASLRRAKVFEFALLRAESCNQAVELLQKKAKLIDAVILDLGLPDANRDDVVDRIRETGNAPVVILSGYDDSEFAHDLLNNGIQEYLVKGRCNGRSVAMVLAGAIERWQLRQRVAQLQRLLDAKDKMAVS